MRLTKLFVLILLTLGAMSLLIACGSDEPQAVKIGMLSPETGPIAQFAPGFADAADVALAEINAAYPDFTFELIVLDSGCDGTQAATAAQSLIDAGVSAIVGAACSGATLGAIAVAAPAGIPMLSYASTSPAITTANSPPETTSNPKLSSVSILTKTGLI